MADLVFNGLKRGLADGTIDLTNDTLKLLLVTSVYTPNADDDFLDAGGASDITDAELNVTGYTRGFGGAGRKTLASKTFTTNDTNDRAEFDAADITWTALGTGQTIAAAVLVKEITNDAASVPLIYFDISDIPTNGSDVVISSPTGLLYVT